MVTTQFRWVIAPYVDVGAGAQDIELSTTRTHYT